MALPNFRAYQLAMTFRKLSSKLAAPKYLKEQLDRASASASVALNLSEGSAKPTLRDRRRFYYTALGSLRECQTILDVMEIGNETEVTRAANHLGATLYKLCRSLDALIQNPDA